MNWTEGRLQRHSNKANSATQRQKQHFAKVALSLCRHSKYKSPVKRTIFDRVAKDRKRSQHKSSTASTPVRPNFEQSRALARRHLGLDNARSADLHERGESTTPAPDKVIPHLTNSHQDLKPARVPDDDLYNATPPPRKMKRQRDDSLPPSEVESFVEMQEEETILEKKRRILLKGDWVGINFQKPLQVTFPSPRDEENIGRRRKIPHGGHRARYEKRQAHITSPFPPRARRPGDIVPSAWARYQQELESGKSDVRISIGGRVVPPGLSSSSAPGTLARQKSQDTQSDVMLLDHNSIPQYQDQGTYHNTFHNFIPSPYNQNRHQCEASQLSQAYLPREAPSDNGETYQYPEINEGWAGLSSSKNDPSDARDGSVRDMYEERRKAQAYVEFENKESLLPLVIDAGVPSRMVFSSSSASIHHPMPQSSRTSMLIRSDSPEEAQSTMAQVGQRQPVVPSSQGEENEVWESWIAPLYQEPSSQDASGLHNRGYHTAGSISPGISMVAPPRRPFEAYASSPQESSSNLVDFGDDGLVEESSSQGLASQPTPEWSKEFEISQLERDATPEANIEFQRIANCQHNLPNVIQKPVNLESQEQDADEAWRKFVFGSSSDKDNETNLMPSTGGWDGHLPEINSSIIAQPPTSSDQDDQKFATPRIKFEESWQRPQQTSCMKSHPTVSQKPQMWVSSISPKDFTSARASTSLAVHASSSSEYTSGPGGNIDSRSPRKVMFTKPKPFIGRASMGPLPEEEVLHIGRRLLDGQKGARSERAEEYDITTEYDRDDIESIEDT